MTNILNNGDNPKEGDGVALHSTNHPFHVTPQMIAAGEKAFEAMWRPDKTPTDMVQAVYQAMRHAEPPDPDLELNEDALEQALVEIYLAKEVVEELAIRAALGNNGGEWAKHYTEAQKEHWRQWVRDFFEHVLEAERQIRLVRDGK